MSHLALKGFSQTCQTSPQRMSTVTSNKHSQLKNNQGRPSICCNRKAAPTNAGWFLQITTWYLRGQRPNVTSLVLSGSQNKPQVTFFPVVTGKAEPPYHPCCSTRLKDAALGQMCQELQFLVLNSLHQQCYWHNRSVSSSHLL